MSEVVSTLFAGLFAVVVLVGLAVVFLKIIDRLWFGSSEAELAEKSRRHLERLPAPDFAALETHFGCTFPACVKALYADREEIMRSDFEVAPHLHADDDDRHFIAWYQPADMEALQDQWPGTEGFFAFADDGFGDAYCIDPKESDPAVHFYDHEDGAVTLVCDRFSEFLRWPRIDPDADKDEDD